LGYCLLFEGRIGVDKNFDFVVILKVFVEVFDDLPIEDFILYKELVDFKQLPVL
jgi:hypothetical protein